MREIGIYRKIIAAQPVRQLALDPFLTNMPHALNSLLAERVNKKRQDGIAVPSWLQLGCGLVGLAAVAVGNNRQHRLSALVSYPLPLIREGMCNLVR
jgi:hypothetical protein